VFKKNILFSAIVTLIFLLVLYTATFFYSKYVVHFSNLELLKYNNQIAFIEKYSKRLHHLRHYSEKYIDYSNPKNLLFYSAKHNKPNQQSVLFIGDSWFEQLLSYKLSKDLLNDYLEKNKINSINGAISSYSPSMMLIQYKILVEDFKLKPNYLIIYIDQNDFGDEVCRYKNSRYFKKKDNKLELWSIKDVLITPRLINLSKIENDNIPNFFKEIKLFNYYLKERLILALNKSKKIFNKNKNIYGCPDEKLFSYLINPSKNDLDYFKNSLSQFLDYVYNDDKLKKVLIVTFPHRNNLKNVPNFEKTKNYNIDVGDLVKEYIINKDKMHHLNFTDLIKKNIFEIEKNDFLENDPHSHLKAKSHLRFTSSIIEKIKNIID
jgi:hypothetical protein